MSLHLDNIPMPNETSKYGDDASTDKWNESDKASSPYVSDSVAWLRARQALQQVSSKSPASTCQNSTPYSSSAFSGAYYAAAPSYYYSYAGQYNPGYIYSAAYQPAAAASQHYAPFGKVMMRPPLLNTYVPRNSVPGFASAANTVSQLTPSPPKLDSFPVVQKTAKPVRSKPLLTNVPQSSSGGLSMAWKPVETTPVKAQKPIETPKLPPASPQTPINSSTASTAPKPNNYPTTEMPDGAKRYVIRAMESAKTPQDELKIEQMLRVKLMPLLQSGLAWRMNWDDEPLPTDGNFVLPAGDAWTPAAELKKPSVPASAKNKFITGRNVFAEDDDENFQQLRKLSRKNKKAKRQFDVLQVNTQYALAKRNKPSRKNKQQRVVAKFQVGLDQEVEEEAKRRRILRFANDSDEENKIQAPSSFVIDNVGDRLDNINVNADPEAVVGTCQTISKRYLRLTSVPDPSQVRPQSVLEMALAMVKRDWEKNSNYNFACDQLKSIRQDLMVQRIRNEFTVEVYEMHARLALRQADKEEFNQCQNQLKLLYSSLDGCPNEAEFLAYRLMFYVFTENELDAVTALRNARPELRKHSVVDFACRYREAWVLGDFHAFFQLYKRAPAMCGCLIDLVLDRERKKALKRIIKAHRPTKLPVTYVANNLAFDDDNSCVQFLESVKVTHSDDLIDCKQNQVVGG